MKVPESVPRAWAELLRDRLKPLGAELARDTLGFVLLGCPEQCPRIVNLLAESYNPHLRYGAAMAVGIACAGTGASPRLAMPSHKQKALMDTLLDPPPSFVI